MPFHRGRGGWPSTATSNTSRSRSISATPSNMSGSSTGTGTASRSRSRSTTGFTGTTSTSNRNSRSNNYWANRRRRGGSSFYSSTNRSRSVSSTPVDPHSKRAMSVMSSVTDRIPPSSTSAGNDNEDELEHAADRRDIEFQENDEQWVTSITESKGSTGIRTVGIAAFQPSTATCILTQLNDSQTYIKTVHTLSVSLLSSFPLPRLIHSDRDDFLCSHIFFSPASLLSVHLLPFLFFPCTCFSLLLFPHPGQMAFCHLHARCPRSFRQQIQHGRRHRRSEQFKVRRDAAHNLSTVHLRIPQRPNGGRTRQRRQPALRKRRISSFFDFVVCQLENFPLVSSATDP